MAKGYQAHCERREQVASLGKILGKRARFRCEWCEGKDDLRPWEYRPSEEPGEENVALLCASCRELAAGKKAATDELRNLRNALWSPIPAVAEGVARVLAAGNELWAREAIEESLIDEELKRELLK